MPDDFQADVSAIQQIAAVPTILKVVCEATGMGFAAVARVTEDRWIACEVLDNVHFGLKPGGELKIETTLCNEVRGNRFEIVIDNVAEDPVYANHHTPRMYGLQSYISVPIILPDGEFFGTLCAIHGEPAKLNNLKTLGMFRMFAELIALHFDNLQKLSASETSLFDERATSELREQFIAVLGHDLRNPLSSFEAGINLLAKTSLDDKAQTIVPMMRQSVGRMSKLVNNILDLARGRMAGGIVLEASSEIGLHTVIEQVIDEMRLAHTDREIVASINTLAGLSYDRIRIEQLVSNLLGNALTHGSADGPIRAEAIVDDDSFDLSVSNAGEPISAEILDRLFQPFFRAKSGPNKEGLGLGLYIANQIAIAHGGTLTATSDAQETRFRFRMPALMTSDGATIAK